jgi:hypothetical protein
LMTSSMEYSSLFSVKAKAGRLDSTPFRRQHDRWGEGSSRFHVAGCY